MSGSPVQGTSIFLAGFMGAGKSSVGRCLADKTGLAFLDTDALIEAEAGATVRDIFATRGEQWFRRAEARAVRRAAGLSNTVVSLGGGALLDQRNVDAVTRAGAVIWLRASAGTVLARLSADAADGACAGIAARPLLERGTDLERLSRIMAAREPGYRQAHLAVDTDGKRPEEVARELVRLVSGYLADRSKAEAEADRVISVTAGDATYPYYVGRGALGRVSKCLSFPEASQPAAGAKPRQVIVVTTCLLRLLFGATLQRGLHAWGAGAADVTWAVVPEGERAKSLSVLAHLYDLACAAGARRDCLVMALGGGTVGDLAGFFAATYMRGIGLVHVPTTLLAMVDSAIGGKTGVNLRAGKNLAGAFWQPVAVVADVATLRTLPASELAFGLAEAVKAAIIGDPALFDMLDAIAQAQGRRAGREAAERSSGLSAGRHRFAVARALQHDPSALHAIICRSVAVKARMIAADERDRAERLLLNLGHTLGHAVEQAGGFRRWTHGEAVAIGLAAACRASARLGHLAPESAERVANLLSNLGLPTSLSPKDTARLSDRIREAMMHDKKAAQGGLRIILPLSIGHCVVRDDVPGETLMRGMEG